MSGRVVLGLGSNRGDGRSILTRAARELAAELSGLRLSSLYSSAPLYVLDQPAFLNAAVAADYDGDPYRLLDFVNEVEARFGRKRESERRRGERTLDIDILLFGGRVVADPPRLEIPHPGLLERKFALLPLLELWPGARDPRTGKHLAEAWSALGEQGIYYADLAPL